MKGTSIFVTHECYNYGEKGYNQDRCPTPRKFFMKCNFLGHTQETCTRGQKIEGGTLINLRLILGPPIPSSPNRTPGLPIPARFKNKITDSPLKENRLNEDHTPPLSSTGLVGAQFLVRNNIPSLRGKGMRVGFWNIRRTGSAIDVGLQRAANLNFDIFFLVEVHLDRDKDGTL